MATEFKIDVCQELNRRKERIQLIGWYTVARETGIGFTIITYMMDKSNIFADAKGQQYWKDFFDKFDALEAKAISAI